MTDTEVVEIGIPKEIAEVWLTVGMWTPYRSPPYAVTVSDSNWRVQFPKTFFQEEIGGGDPIREGELVEQLTAALKEQGFRQKGDRSAPEGPLPEGCISSGGGFVVLFERT